ncbi:hypothetical protein BDP27DRAFT_1366713 [Rhodocollybia butyracea]|uniref:DUF6535 domain-containing protein n=1 Tax=Rhodocollybia butyracea TaxID=206335 RepID=A0A9P5U414_9AGAR|nr:hypothetical protein BDP27DRAFT_1366713 [Rhodocollybia butyracea]
MEQSFRASFDDSQLEMKYSEEMLSLMSSIHSIMQAREEREATILQSSSDPAHPAPVPLLVNGVSVPSSPHIQDVEPISTQASAHSARASNAPNNLPVPVTGSGTKNTPFKVRRFGLKKDQAARNPLEASYDYTLKYPEDKRYHELDPEARIWRVYGDEAAAFDNDMVGELSDSLDILLVFAGLFSAVLTTFVAQTSQSLSQDYTQLSASYLSELTLLVRANANSTAISNIPSTSTAFSPAILDLWVNGLWFTSLVIALSVALFAVLAKQWLRQYMSIVTGTPQEQAFIRQFRLDGLEKWRVQSLIGMLPTLLHLALILFFVGLIIFLIPLSTIMAYIVGAISVTVVVLYLMATVLPLFTVQCSYKTTLTHLLYSRILYTLFWGLYVVIISAYNWMWKRPMDPEFPDVHMSDIGNTLKDGERFVACHRQKSGFSFSYMAWTLYLQPIRKESSFSVAWCISPQAIRKAVGGNK